MALSKVRLSHEDSLQAMQRLGEYKTFLVKMVRSKRPDLTYRQFAVMLIVFMDEPPHTVRGLAARLNVAKPAVTRALDRLGGYDYVRRKKDPMDGRSVLVQMTPTGDRYIKELITIIGESEATSNE